MKKFLLPFLAAVCLILASPERASAQCPANADQIACFKLPSGSCVAYPSGQFRFWLTAQIVWKAKPYMDMEFDYSYMQYVSQYYETGAMTIQYLGGSWATGQSFRVKMGNCVVVVLVDGEF